MVEPGRRCLGDRYELDRLIAAGGMGQVWRGQDIALHRKVAVKVLRAEYTGDETFRARFRAEAQHAASLSHPNVAKVFDYGEETAQDGTGETLAYLVMELVEGEPLSNLLAREGRLDTDATLSVLRQTASALAEAHRAGLVHRDVKPGNILVCDDGAVKITDFGIAWSARSVALTRTGQVIGTPQYLSPEQAEGRHATPASDVYALGLIAYECLTGRPAFDGDNAVTIALKQVREQPEPLPADLPPGIRGLVARSLAKDPDERLPDGAAFVAAIEAVVEGRDLPPAPATVTAVRPAAAVPPPRARSAVSRPPAAARRNRVAMVLLPLLGLLAGGAIAVAVLQALSGEVQSPAAAATPRGDGSVVLDADDYVGRPIDEVRNALLQLGLDVQPVGVARSDLPPGEVLDVDPSGEPLDDGDTVVVTYAVAPSGPSAPRGGGTGGGATGAAVGEDPAATGVAEPTEQAPVAEEPTPTGDAGPTEQPGTPQPTETAPPDGTTAPTTPTESTGGTTSSPATDGEL